MCEPVPAKLKCFFQRRIYSTNIDCFVSDLSPFHLSFVAFCLLSVIRKQWLKQCNYSVDQSALLTDRFYVISMEFPSLSCRRSSSRNVPSGEERWVTAVFADLNWRKARVKGNRTTTESRLTSLNGRNALHPKIV